MPWEWLDMAPERRAFLIASLEVYAEDEKEAEKNAKG
jgi:hypothetical protein